MDGNRCLFPYCPVTAQNSPNMRFFNIPPKQEHLFAKWVKIIDDMDLLLLPDHQIKHRSICARHFRDECFMSYKRDRLISSNKAVPTLLRLNDRLAYDFAKAKANKGPKLIKLRKQRKMHLIPPRDFALPYTLHDNLPDDYVPGGTQSLLTVTSLSPVQREVRKRNYSPTSDEGGTAKAMKVQNTSSIDDVVTINLADEQDENLESVLEQTDRIVAVTAAIHALGDLSQNASTSNPKCEEHNTTTTLSLNDLKDKSNRTNAVKRQSKRTVKIDKQNTIASARISLSDLHDATNTSEDSLLCILESSTRPLENREEHKTIAATRISLLDLADKSNMSENSLSCVLGQTERTVNSEKNSLMLLNDEEKCITRGEYETMIKHFENQLEVISNEHKNVVECMSLRIGKLETLLEKTQLELLQTAQKFVATDTQLDRVTKTHKKLLLRCNALHSNNVEFERKKFVTPDLMILREENNILLDKCVELQCALREQGEVATVSVQTTDDPLTKRQLCEDISRYISPSLAAVLGMELFGSAKRDWKPDERRAAMDLLQLGENVYQYMICDWDIQLPPLRLVRGWLKEIDPDADQEFLHL